MTSFTNNNLTQKKPHYYWLDLLRLLCALIVVMAHCRDNFFQIFSFLKTEYQNIFTKMFYFITTCSDDAVFIFFILSGFLVGGQTIEKIIHGVKINHKEFLINRGIRIFVPLAATILVIFIVNIITGKENNYYVLVGNLFSLQGVLVPNASGILWTMPYIIWFYVFIYSIILVTDNRASHKIPGLILLIITIAVFTALKTSLIIIILSGSLSYYLSKRNIKFKYLIIFILTIICAAILRKFALPSKSIASTWVSNLSVPVLEVIESLSLSIIISQIVRIIPTSPKGILFDKIAGKISVFSYSLYLIHYEIIKLMMYFGFPQSYEITPKYIGLWLIEVIICCIAGYIFYFVVEKRTGNMRKWAIKKFN